MIGIDMKMPKSCRRCKLKVIEEDMCGDFFYYCPLISQAMWGKDKDKKHKDCPLKEIKEEEIDYEATSRIIKMVKEVKEKQNETDN